MIDAHIHLSQYDRDTLYEQINTWQEAGVKQVIAVSNDLQSSYKTLELQQTFPHFVLACVGFHPEYPLPCEQEVEEWKRLVNLERERITAIGEIGLPHYNLASLPQTLEQSIDFLGDLLHVASAHNLPVALHAVHDKAEIVYSLLQKASIKHAHFHWLKAPEHTLNQIIEADYFVSVTPEVCYRLRDQKLAKKVPLTQLLIETDGPWPFEGIFKNKQTTPLFLAKMLQQLAKIKRTTPQDVQKQTFINTKHCYKLQN
ncbi:TatD family hydrolase [bacterium LRH843]|nr:TatD family hydrolase [bacterium LRH843]